ncbi:MAG: hypothetical protein QXE92_00460 [Thermofilaceae archaeon]
MEKVLQMWSCKTCSTTFFTEKMEGARCPRCGLQAEYKGDVRVFERAAIEEVIEGIIRYECSDCWVNEEGVDENNYEEAAEVIRECPIAELRRILYGTNCLREVCRNPAAALLM